jgi:hypothetical protein
MLKVIIFSFTALLSVQAFAVEGECFRSEINPKTQKVYTSEKVYQADIDQWQTRAPESPGMAALMKAYNIFTKEKKIADSLKNDKKAHCYIGCRISQDVNFKTAEYVGWMKEDQDIRDCKAGTHFDELDLIATIKGAEFGQTAADAKACLTSCQTVRRIRK